MANIVLYIEGTTHLENGDLRRAFHLFLEKEMKGKMPRIVMGDGKEQTIDKFHTTPLKTNEVRFLLVDSDKQLEEESQRTVYAEFNNRRKTRLVDCTQNNTFFMIQEAEAWILSQPEVLKKEAKLIKVKIPQMQIMAINNPSDYLASIYKGNGKTYHKVIDFCKVFPKLDTKVVIATFNDFKRLLEEIKEATLK